MLAHIATSTRPLTSSLSLCPVVTGLPPSQGNNTILTVVHQFSKMAHLVSLPNLPLAKEMAELLLQHGFCLHGFRVDQVSDWGAQFLSVFLEGILGQRVTFPMCLWVPAFTVSCPRKGRHLPLHPGLDSLGLPHLGPGQNHPPAFSEPLHVDCQFVANLISGT